MREMVRKWTRRKTMTVMKDDGDDNNSRVPDKTDDHRLYDSRYILYHSNVVDTSPLQSSPTKPPFLQSPTMCSCCVWDNG